VITPTVQVLPQPVASWSYLISGIGRYPRPAERHLPIRRLIWIWLLNGLTCTAL
jgi:hypothetical protein